MNIIKAIETAYRKKSERNYKFLYWCIDLHGVILEGKYNLNNDGAKPYPYALKTLKLISNNPSNKIILWTSSYVLPTAAILTWLNENNIKIHFINENPDYTLTELCDFTKKFFFDILFDDKAGFEGEKDWEPVYNYLKYREKVGF